jgi:hypothetical protein
MVFSHQNFSFMFQQLIAGFVWVFEEKKKRTDMMLIKKKSLRFTGRFTGGPDGIRTRDLGLDRAACLAATPRDRAECSLP